MNSLIPLFSSLVMWVSLVIFLVEIPSSKTFCLKREWITRRTGPVLKRKSYLPASVGGEHWNEFLEPHQGKVIGPAALVRHLLESSKQTVENQDQSNYKNNQQPWSRESVSQDSNEQKQKIERQMNIAKAYDTLRNQLPLFFYQAQIDFSIFSDYILVSDNSQNRITMSKSVYTAVIKSIQMASSLSKIYPSLNLQSIHYLPELNSIQCRVQIVLPDSIRIEGQSIWEGLLYFGFDEKGLINAHIFDRNLPIMKPDPVQNKATTPWLRIESLWNLRPSRHDPEYPLPGTVFGVSLADRMASSLSFDRAEELSSLPDKADDSTLSRE